MSVPGRGEGLVSWPGGFTSGGRTFCSNFVERSVGQQSFGDSELAVGFPKPEDVPVRRVLGTCFSVVFCSLAKSLMLCPQPRRLSPVCSYVEAEENGSSKGMQKVTLNPLAQCRYLLHPNTLKDAINTHSTVHHVTYGSRRRADIGERAP